MTRRQPGNSAASVLQRLLNVARGSGEEHNLLLLRYATERLLYRLSRSAYQDQFVLKGATLFALWTGVAHRPTRDIDFLASGSPEPARFVEIFQEICGSAVGEEDGVTFLPDTVHAEALREEEQYVGVRLRLNARIGNARMTLQIDLGFGDALVSAPRKETLPSLLGLPCTDLWVYPRESVIAEKCEAMVDLGMANSRMKDYYDLWFLSRHFDVGGEELTRAIAATFQRRGTPIPTDTPLGLSNAFSEDAAKQQQWQAFVQRSKLQGEGLSLMAVVLQLHQFLMPVLMAAGTGSELEGVWSHQTGAWVASL
jgi:predicted nucleotidyltransferase component of viral defense system